MAANGQRIHPAGSRSTRPALTAMPPCRRHLARPLARTRRLRRGLRRHRLGRAVARGRRHGARGGRPRRPPRRGLHRQLGRRRRPPDPDPRTGCSTATPTGSACTSSRACRSAWAPSSCPRQPDALGASVAHDRGGARRRRHPVPRLARRADQSGGARAHGARVLSGDPPGAGGPARARGGRGGVGARALSGATRDGATSERAEPARASTSAPSPAAPSSTRPSSPAPSSRPSTPTSATRSTRAPSRSSTSATRPTRCRAGRWRSRSGCWPTTARSTRSGATGTR